MFGTAARGTKRSKRSRLRLESLEARCLLNGEPLGEIHGTAWDDANANGIRDSGEHALADWIVYVDLNDNAQLDFADTNNNSQFDPGVDANLEPLAVTDANGEYAIASLAAGTYTVRELLKPGWVQTVAGPGPAFQVGQVLSTYEASPPLSGDEPENVVAADFNGDGRLDLATGNFLGASVSVFLNRGDGKLADAVVYPVYPGSPGVGQVNFIAAADLDHDGDVDLVAPTFQFDDVVIFVNDGTGAFPTRRSLSVGGRPDRVAVADVDCDGLLDLAVSQSGENVDAVSLFKNLGNGNFGPASVLHTGFGPRDVRLEDLDRDGDRDLVVLLLGDNSVQTFRHDGQFNFAPWQQVSVGSQPPAAAIGDFNADGYLDMAVPSVFSDNLAVLINNRDGTFAQPVFHNVSTRPRGATATDLDYDGDLDVVVASREGNALSILLNHGDGTFDAPFFILLPGTGPDPSWITSADLDCDGFAELAISNEFSNTVTVVHNLAGSRGVTIQSGGSVSGVNFGNLWLSLVVTNTDDSGPGSLRQAILNANRSPSAPDTIVFEIPGGGSHVIELTAPLPQFLAPMAFEIAEGTAEIGTYSSFDVDGFTSLTKTGDGKLVLGGDGALCGLSLNVAQGEVELAAGTGIVLAVDALSVGSGAVLDLTDNDLVVHANALTHDAVLANITALVTSGANGLAWNGPGIHSSVAASDEDFLTALGVMLNQDGVGGAYHTSFSGESVGPNDVLVKYTYYGDANLSGAVEGTDYALIDNGFNHGLHAWFNGDFDYSGHVDGTDYALIDNAFNHQGAPLAAGEPAALGPMPRAADGAQRTPSGNSRPAAAGFAVALGEWTDDALLSLVADEIVGVLPGRARRR